MPAIAGGELASPWIRLGAGILDALILLPINWIFKKVFLHMPTITDAIKAGQSGNPIDIKSLMPSTGSMILASVVGFAVFLAVNFVFLKNGQTIGKKLLKLQVVKRGDGTVLPIQDYLLKRLGPIYAVNFLSVIISPFIGLAMIVDALCIFRSGRNTLHDDIAGSKVVRLPA